MLPALDDLKLVTLGINELCELAALLADIRNEGLDCWKNPSYTVSWKLLGLFKHSLEDNSSKLSSTI